MNDIKTQLFDLSTNTEIALGEWLLNLFILLILITGIRWVYIKKSNTISNKILFANTFYAFALAIFLIISTIKASLALSLGLVGALSIIRFRTAIKEPEQLVYLFMIIGLSIGLAAQQIITSSIITLVFLFWQFTSKQSNSYINKDLMTLSFTYIHNDDLKFVFDILKKTKTINGFEKIRTTQGLAEFNISVSRMSDTDFLNLKTILEETSNLDKVQISFISSLTF